MELFGTDGVRGLAGGKLNAFTVMRLAMSAGIYFRKRARTNKILVGKDTRRSGYMIENALVSGLTAVGYSVIQIGPMPTPAIAFLTENMRCDAGIMITASHNPFYDNGIKFFNCDGNKLSKIDERAIERIFKDTQKIEDNFAIKRDIGRSKRIDDVVGRYIVLIKNSFPRELSLAGVKIVVDCANGASYHVAPTIFEELGAEVIPLNVNPTGFNINTNCGAMHPEHLAQKVVEEGADIGIALDGDADRIVVVDENGDIIDGDKLIGALSVYLKREGKLASDSVVATVMSNQALEEYLKENGITLVRSAVGDKNVVEVMKSIGSNFGGEQSGHIIFSEYAKTGDGLLTSLQVLAYILYSNKKTSEAFDIFELYPQLQENLKISTKKPIDEIAGTAELFQEIEAKNMRHLVRYSGTENLIRILVEGKDTVELEIMMGKAVELFRKALAS
jgi:phosphoglucosamine mutase